MFHAESQSQGRTHGQSGLTLRSQLFPGGQEGVLVGEGVCVTGDEFRDSGEEVGVWIGVVVQHLSHQVVVREEDELLSRSDASLFLLILSWGFHLFLFLHLLQTLLQQVLQFNIVRKGQLSQLSDFSYFELRVLE